MLLTILLESYLLLIIAVGVGRAQSDGGMAIRGDETRLTGQSSEHIIVTCVSHNDWLGEGIFIDEFLLCHGHIFDIYIAGSWCSNHVTGVGWPPTIGNKGSV